MVIVHRRIKS